MTKGPAGGSPPVVLGLDAGGTWVRAGCVTADGAVLQSVQLPMDSSSRKSTLAGLEAGLQAILQAWDGPAPLAIGVGLVGQTDPRAGTWLQSINLPVRSPVPLARRWHSRYGLPVALDNDVHAAALAELRWGAGREASDFIYLNVGTGLAAGLVCGGELVRGAANYAGELGHMFVDPDGPLCTCGRRGCLEPIASGGGMRSQVRSALPAHPESPLNQIPADELTAHAVFQAADAGDRLAAEISGRAVRGLALALANLLNLLNPALVAYGGGALASGWLMQRVLPLVQTLALPAALKGFKGLLPSRLQPDQAGLLGAACLAWESLSKVRS